MNSRTPSRLLIFILTFLQSWRFLCARSKLQEPKVIWVVHQLLLGDTIMLTGLLAKLNNNYPDAKIFMIGNPAFKQLYEGKPFKVEYIGYSPRSIKSLLTLLYIPKPDWALVPGDNRYGWLAFARGAKWLVGFSGDRPPYKQWCFDELLPFPDKPTSVVEIMEKLCPGSQPPVFQKEQWNIHNESPLPKLDGLKPDYVLFQLGAKSKLKHWPTQNWIDLADYFKKQRIPVVLGAAKGEEAQLDIIIERLNLPSYRGNLSLLQLTEVMQKARLIISLDNGVGQLAKIITTPTICLFGGGSTELFAEADFWKAIKYESVTTHLECRNTHNLFKRKVFWINTCNRTLEKCLHKRALCMESISLGQVINSVKKISPRASS